jgi:hypothetical protein
MFKNFSWEYVKKNPVMFGVIFVVFGLLLWLLINRGASGGSGSTTYVASGPSEALQAANLQAGTQIQLAQISANSANNQAAFQLEALSQQIEGQSAIAALEMQFRTLELAASERMTALQTNASLAALQAQLNTQAAMTESNNAFALDYAKTAQDAAVATVAINAALQRDLSAQQLQAYESGLRTSVLQGILATIPSLKKKDRDTALGGFLASVNGQSFTGGRGDDRISIGAPTVSILPGRAENTPLPATVVLPTA